MDFQLGESGGCRFRGWFFGYSFVFEEWYFDLEGFVVLRRWVVFLGFGTFTP